MTAARPLVIDPAENLCAQRDATRPDRADTPGPGRVADRSSPAAAGPGGLSPADPAPEAPVAAPAVRQEHPSAGGADPSAGQADPAPPVPTPPVPAFPEPAPAARGSAATVLQDDPAGPSDPAPGRRSPSAPPPVAAFVAPPPDPALAEDTVPYLPRGVRLADDVVRGMRVLQAPERAMQLDPVGEAILSALDGRPLGAVIDGLAAAYSAPRDQIAGDVTAFLQGLIDRRMVFVRLP